MSITVAANAGDRVVRTFLLLKCDLASGPVYWTNCDLPIVTNAPARSDCAPAATWTPRPFKVSGVTSEQGVRAGAAIDLGNADNVLSAILFGATNPVGSPVHVYEAWFDPATTTAIPDDSTQLAEARIGQLNMRTAAGVATATISLAPFADFATRVFPRRLLTQKCSFIFKGPGCQSTGTDTSCDGTLAACSLTTKRAGAPAGGNRDNFGGFPMLPSMGL